MDGSAEVRGNIERVSRPMALSFYGVREWVMHEERAPSLTWKPCQRLVDVLES